MREGEGLKNTAGKWARRLAFPERRPWSTAVSIEVWSILLVAHLGAALLLTPDLSLELSSAVPENAKAWKWMLLVLPAATITLSLVPAGLLHVAAARSKRKTLLHGLGLCASFIAWFLILADAALYQRFGRHWDDVLAYALEPQGHAAAGSATGNALLALVLATWALLGAALTAALRETSATLISRISTNLRRLSIGVGTFLTATLVATLWLLPPLLPGGFGPRLYASLAIRPGDLLGSTAQLPQDQKLAQLQLNLHEEYERLFPFVFQRHTPKPKATTLESPPDIAIVVVESFRWEQLTPDLMPRLSAWAEQGLRAERHYAGSNHSESGLFSLLYGESALRLNSTLDHKTPPTLCELVRASGYRCGYYTGHPKVWLRREEFLSAKTMDDFVHNDTGSWNDWDRHALEASRKRLSDDTRRLSLTFLMSSHFEYRYPDKYRKHLPDDAPSTGWLPGRAKKSEFEASRNRYLNVTAFIDDLVADYVEALGPNTLIFFTGDHGESTGEDGRFGHGYGFSDLLTRVPFVLVGPGISPGVRSELSAHHDLLPTILHALKLPRPEGTLGHALQTPARSRSLLSTYTRHGRPVADALLIDGNLRLKLRLDPTRPEVQVLGFEDPVGKPVEKDLTDADVLRLTQAFTRQLEATGRPVIGD